MVFYNKKHYQEASVVFQLLVSIAPGFSGFWLALGHSERAMAHLELATLAYVSAGSLGEGDPLPVILAAHLNSKSNKEVAKACLDSAKEMIFKKGLKGQYEEELRVVESALRG